MKDFLKKIVITVLLPACALLMAISKLNRRKNSK